MILQDIHEALKCDGFKSDKGTIHSYLEVYEEILAPYLETAKNILEIGIFKGDSLRMWKQYFFGDVYGVDCDIMPHGGMADLTEMVKSGEFNIKLFDATNENAVKDNFEGIMFDVIVEDAGHAVEQQVELYNIWKNYLTPNGIYIIEDVQDIDNTRFTFENLDNSKNITILDLRNMKGRYDDVLVIIKDK